MPDQFQLPFVKIRVGRFLFLLIAIMLWMIFRPFLEAFIRISILMDIFFAIILISAVYAVSQRRGVFIAGLTLAIMVVITGLTNRFVNISSLGFAWNVMAILFFVFTVVIILAHLFSEKDVTGDIIMGAISVYFLIGLMWAFIYALLEMLQPGSFQMSQGMDTEASHFNYYSFVTLTTLGYGDITPISNQARSLSVLESAMGQIYLAVLIARLVGMHISQTHGKRP